MTLRIVVVAEESAGVRLLRALAGLPHEVVAVVTSPPTVPGAASVHDVAAGMGLPVSEPSAIRQGIVPLPGGEQGCDLLLNVHSLHILPDAILETPRLGCYNLHPGPLPEMAGLNVPSWAIFSGHRRHAVTVHRMDAGIDTGPIAYREDLQIGSDDTGLSLMSRCIRAGVPLVLRVVEDAAAGRDVPASKQDRRLRRYYPGPAPNGGWIDWNWPAWKVSAFMRACDYGPFPWPWGRPRFGLGGIALQPSSVEVARRPVREAAPGTVLAVDDDAIDIATSDGSVRLMGVRPAVERETLPDIRPGLLATTPAPGDPSSDLREARR